MDIGSGSGWPGSSLSNFAPHPFMFRDVYCASMEGLLQSLKFEHAPTQKTVCQLVGKAAKFRGKKRNKAWRTVQTLWWDGEPIPRHSQAYQDFLDEAFDALAENDGFRRALLATGDAVLTHSIGKSTKQDTVLTRSEFTSRLHKIRDRLRGE